MVIGAHGAWRLALLAGAGLTAWAQGLTTPGGAGRDSLACRPNIAGLPRSRFVAQYDSRYFILNHHFTTTFNGLKLGIELKNCFRTGAAIYSLSTGVPTQQASPPDASPAFEAQIRFRHLAPYVGYVLLKTRR